MIEEKGRLAALFFLKGDLKLALNRHELFRTLLKKLDLDKVAQRPPYSTGTVDKLEVHTKSKLWCLYIGLDSILPYQQFTQFYQKLQTCFQNVARLKLIIKVSQPRLTNQLVQAYWNWVLQHGDFSSSTALRISRQFRPLIRGRQILLVTSNEVVKDYWQKQDLTSISRVYIQLGFPRLGIQVKMKPRTDRDFKKLRLKERKRNAKVVKSATNSLIKKKKQRRLQAMGIGQLIDRQNKVIPIEQLCHEARSVTIEGVVQAKELQPLISGRKLLLITLADQTASIQVKIFARNRGGQAASTSIKKGMHLKVQGSLRLDQATQDLMVTAYNVNLLTIGEK